MMSTSNNRFPRRRPPCIFDNRFHCPPYPSIPPPDEDSPIGFPQLPSSPHNNTASHLCWQGCWWRSSRWWCRQNTAAGRRRLGRGRCTPAPTSCPPRWWTGRACRWRWPAAGTWRTAGTRTSSLLPQTSPSTSLTPACEHRIIVMWIQQHNWIIVMLIQHHNWITVMWLQHQNWIIVMWIQHKNWITVMGLQHQSWITVMWLQHQNWITVMWLDHKTWITVVQIHQNWITIMWLQHQNWITVMWLQHQNWITVMWIEHKNWIIITWLQHQNWITVIWVQHQNWITVMWLQHQN